MHTVDDFADVANAGAAGGVHLHHIDMAAFHDCGAMFALPARLGCRAAVAIRPDAVHALGDDPRGRGFAGAADARHDEGLRDAVGLKGVLQRAHHRILTDQIGKGFGAVFAGKNAILRRRGI